MTHQLYLRIDPAQTGDTIYLYIIAEHTMDEWKVLVHRPGERTYKTILSKRWVRDWYIEHNDPVLENMLRLSLL